LDEISIKPNNNIMRKTKLIETEDGELAIQFTDEELAAVGWKEGDNLQWIPTKEGYKLMKIDEETNGIKVNAELDDKAHAVGDFIQQLGDVQEQKFEVLWQECKEKEWIKGMEEETARDWLFDYVFNGWEKDSLGFYESFSEYCGADWE
jgi:hypothetical protein